MQHPVIDELDKKIIALTQGDLPLDPRPFLVLAKKIGITEEAFLRRVNEMKRKGVIRRFGATLRHQEAGFNANAMVAWVVPEERVDHVGRTLARFREVTHCYLRTPQKDWRYNLYTMIHGGSREECRQIAERLSQAADIDDYALLFSDREFKKTSMAYFPTAGTSQRTEEGRPTMGKRSKELFEMAKRYIPGGVNSPVRAGRAVGVDPAFIAKASGCLLWDADGNEYIDYVGSWGPMILGHSHPQVVSTLRERAETGTSYGAPTELEVEMAALIVDLVPGIEMVRMVNSGTEAAMSAIRLARGFTGRQKIVKFDGCYHGHADSLLVSAGSGMATLGIPGSPGVPPDTARHTLSLPFNDMGAVSEAFVKFGEEIAAVIVEPIPGNMGVVPPQKGFLEGLRQITRDRGALLIFDEVISGFRVALGGAQEYFGIVPDLTCLGKIIGGGLPVGAYGGKKDIMSRVAPEGDIYQAGTLSGNPLAMAAGLATLRTLQSENPYADLENKGLRLFSGIEKAARDAGIPLVVNRIGSMGSIFFTPDPVTDFSTAKASDSDLFVRYYKKMMEQGIYLAPSAFEAVFLSTAHSDKIIEKTIACARKTFGFLQGKIS